MPLTKDAVMQGIKQMREQSGKKKFEQSIDISITMSGLDLKKPESKFSLDVVVPHGVGDPKKILVLGDGELARLARNAGADKVINKDAVEELEGNKKEIKKLANEFDFTLAQTDFMVLIGKTLGPVLGPRGKMPKPLPPNANPAPIIEKMRKTVRILSRAQLGLHARIGKESMTDEQLTDNMMAVFEEVERKVNSMGGGVRAAYIKSSMGKPVKLEVTE